MNIFSRMNHRSTGVVLVALAFVFLHLPAQAVDFKNCTGCHKVILEEAFRSNIHVPFQQQRCGECHIPKSLPVLAATVDPAALKDRQKISWLGESVMADSSHGFALPGDKTGNTLVVEVREEAGSFSRKEIAVPPLDGLAVVKDNNGTPPVISDLQVLRVERGVFLSATIGWQTDTLTDALVRYGDKDLSQTSQPGNRFGLRHEIVLNNLKPDQTYRFTAVSRDLFGRSQTSEPMTFSTSKALLATPPTRTGIPPASGEGVELTSSFQRIGADYLLELTLEQPASVLIGARDTSQKPKSTDSSTVPTGGDDKYHAGLSSKRVATLEACGGCHRKTATATHPVNVYPKPGMVIPPEYPTLPDGRITCRSCHETHSSDHEYLTVKGGRRALCVGCHKDML
jgi:predicted CXXCH cytochrome family protein